MLALPDLAVLVPLSLAAMLGFAVETVLGFGATLIAVAAGSFFVDLRLLLPAIAPLNLTLSLYIATRYRRDVDRGVLLGKLVPWMALGMPLGMALVLVASPSIVVRVFGAFLVAVSSLELWRGRDGAAAVSTAPLPRVAEIALLVLGGTIHGAFMTGGPMAVYVSSRLIHDKARYRATLSSLWALLNAVLIAVYAWDGRYGPEERGLTLGLVPAIALGMFGGEVAFRRLPAAAFRRLVFVMLLASGVALVTRR